MPSRTPLLPEPNEIIWITWQWPNPVGLLVAILTCIMLIWIGPPVYAYAKHFIPTAQPTLTPTSTSSMTLMPTLTLSTPMPTLTLLAATSSPAPTPSITPTFTPDPWAKCFSVYKSHLKVGDNATVATYPNVSNRVRGGPYTSRSVIGYINPGEHVAIIDGPSCSNGWVWWKIRSLKTGLVGWTSEGDATDYWLKP